MSVLSDDDLFALYPDVMVDHDNIEHYRGLAARKLLINRCQHCGRWVYPHRPLCPQCWSWDVKFTAVSGRGQVHMFTLIHQSRDPNAPLDAPIPAAAIELEEQQGLRYLARITNCPLDRIYHGMPVRLVWIEAGGAPWPWFEPALAEERARHG